MADGIEAATGVHPTQYFEDMRAFSKGKASRSQWGGFLEASFMCVRWKLRACVLQKQGNNFVHTISFGPKHPAISTLIILAFDGENYTVLKLKPEGLGKMQLMFHKTSSH